MSHQKRPRVDLSSAASEGAAAAAALASSKMQRTPAAAAASSTGAAAAAASSSASNKTSMLTGKPYSSNYWRIFETRKTLPVYAQRQEFSNMLANTQCMILVGETGSGSDK